MNKKDTSALANASRQQNANARFQFTQGVTLGLLSGMEMARAMQGENPELSFGKGFGQSFLHYMEKTYGNIPVPEFPQGVPTEALVLLDPACQALALAGIPA